MHLKKRQLRSSLVLVTEDSSKRKIWVTATKMAVKEWRGKRIRHLRDPKGWQQWQMTFEKIWNYQYFKMKKKKPNPCYLHVVRRSFKWVHLKSTIGAEILLFTPHALTLFRVSSAGCTGILFHYFLSVQWELGTTVKRPHWEVLMA